MNADPSPARSDPQAQDGSHPALVGDLTARNRMAVELRQRDAQLHCLSRFAQQLNAHLEIPAMPRALVTAALELTGAAGGTVGLLMAGRMVFTDYRQADGWIPFEYQFEQGRGVAGWVMETRTPYLSADAEHDPRLSPEIREAFGIHTLVHVPILDRRGELLGGLELHNQAGRESFTDREVELLQGLTASFAVAFEHARLHETAQPQPADPLEAVRILRESEARFRSLFETMAQGVVYQDATGGIIFANPAAQRILGLTLDQMQGRTSADPRWKAIREDGSEFPGEDHPAMIALRTGQPVRDVVMGVCQPPGDRHRWININAVPQFRPAETCPFQVYATLDDITERKRAEAALRESEEQFAVFMENLPAGAFMKDVPGQVVFANRYLRDLFGWGEVIGRTTRELLPTELAVKMEQADRQVLAHGSTTLTEQIRDAANRERIFQTSKFPIAREGRPPLLGGITVDITHLRHTEQRLEAALEEKTVLLREVHHRVKNNLQAMIGLMRMRERQTADPTLRQVLVQLQLQAHTMSLVYEQLYQSENLAQVRMPAYLQALATHVVQAFAGDRDVDLRFEVDDLVLEVADASPCGLIVNELLTNALKHAFPPEFAARPLLQVGLRRKGDRLVLTLADNGRGLPPGLDWEQSPSLGLRLVHLWATHQMGATIEVDNAAGTRYAITFQTSTPPP
ncbi:MAG: PAS domain S-box protein [Limisphaerales bacterium]